MKYLKKTAIYFFPVLFWACSFIDPEEYSLRSADQVVGNMTYLSNLRIAPYSYLPGGYNTIGNSWLAAASDEAEEVNGTELIQNFNFGNWDQDSKPDNVWAKNYA